MPFVILRGDLLRQLRLERGLSQDELRRRCGFHRKTLQRAENGRPVSLATLRRLSADLGVRARGRLILRVVDGGGGPPL